MAERSAEAPTRGGADGAKRGSEEIRREIAERQESISRAVGKLNERIREQLHWRETFQRHPLLTLGVATGVGFLVARALRRPKPPAERIADAMVDAVDDLSHTVRGAIGGLSPGRSAARGILEALAVAAAGKAAASYTKSASREAIKATALQVGTQVAAQAASAFAESRRRRSAASEGGRAGAFTTGGQSASSGGVAGTAKGPDGSTTPGEIASGI